MHTDPVELTIARRALQQQILELLAEFEGKHQVTVSDLRVAQAWAAHPEDVRHWDVLHYSPIRTVMRSHTVEIEVMPW